MVKPDELLLLYAILDKNDRAALDYFAQWSRRVDLDHVEGGSFRLLPLLYRRLAQAGQPVPQIKILKGIYRQSLYRNSLLFHKAFTVLVELKNMGVPFILLKGIALVAAYYEDIGARPMSDVDFLIPEEDVEKTLHFLKERGWQSKDGFTRGKVVKHIHSVDLQNPEGYGLDVHWRAFYQCSWDWADRALWKQTEEVAFKGFTFRILNPTQQILHNCAHGVRWNALSSIRWIVDVLKILEKRGDSIHWDLLVSEANERKITLTILHTLSFLNSKFKAGIPEEALKTLSLLPKHPQELRLYKVLTSPPNFGNIIYKKWLIHSYSLGAAPFWKKAVLFPNFLIKALYQVRSYIRKRTQ